MAVLGMTRLLTVAVVTSAALTTVLAGPSVALACNGGTSAVSVYKECLQGGGGGTHPPATSKGKTSTGKESGAKSPSVSAPAAKALRQAGKDKAALTNLVKTYGLRRHLAGADKSASATTPSPVGSAFDLGSGPTALLIVLVGTAVLILGGSGMRVWRNRHGA